MNLKLFVIFDSKAEYYMPPFYSLATGQAIRTFQDMACDPNHQVGQHPSDYTLFEIGEYDQATAKITMLEAKRPLGTALEYVNMKENEQPILFESNA
jgi:hypothetical protein